ncbi:50S ribosomal protein L18 [Mycoplasma phocoeninasale]|uniref:Large ribosomal subunit protein uL18 n=1 Tax=Mycoplasma phocoeninasale TaxID=2726117 RepID=A0A858U5T7_9MOLU|nr:50S ribosomal protein L18 [Mycoplasma phocoeninasale]MBN0970724.1 50S ribosomal protein L18 [Mycoplasma phocoeninasale]QJG66168.1 50S ribosomal protein L18 [Mycoplasma phocoeninasale]
MLSRNLKRKAKHLKITNKLAKGTETKPRVVVFKSLHHFYAQAVNDLSHTTLASSSTRELSNKGNNIETVKLVAKEFASKLKKANIETIVFDRSGYIYHGKLAAFCDILREEGIRF